MKRLPLKRILPVALLLAVIGGGWYALSSKAAAEAGPLTGSGTVEATQIQIAPEISGRLAEVLVDESETVSSGDILLRFDDQGLLSQRAKIANTGQAAADAAQVALDKARQALDDLKDNSPVITSQAELALANARKALDDAQRRRSYQAQGNRATRETIDGTQAQLVLANDAVDKAEAALNRVKNLGKSDPVRAAAEAALLLARQNRDAIQTSLNWYKGAPTSLDQAVLDAQVSVAQANVTKAELDFQKVNDGPDPVALMLAQDQVAAAESNVAAIQSQQAADLQAIDLQLERLVVRAPVDGVVLTRSVEPGEVLTPGATAMVLGQISQLKITIFLPEDRYGDTKLGEKAVVMVDSYPGEEFQAQVTRIASQAEFTPRNVQTSEGRSTTVFAVDMSVSDPQGKLKPGMPADVRFTGN
jgi:HlyD family secretion protein